MLPAVSAQGSGSPPLHFSGSSCFCFSFTPSTVLLPGFPNVKAKLLHLSQQNHFCGVCSNLLPALISQQAPITKSPTSCAILPRLPTHLPVLFPVFSPCFTPFCTLKCNLCAIVSSLCHHSQLHISLPALCDQLRSYKDEGEVLGYFIKGYAINILIIFFLRVINCHCNVPLTRKHLSVWQLKALRVDASGWCCGVHALRTPVGCMLLCLIINIVRKTLLDMF